MWCTEHLVHAFECECPEVGASEEMSDNMREIIESRQAPGLIIKHPAGQTKYISSLARYPGDPHANVSSVTEAERKARAQGKEIISIDDVSPSNRKPKAEDPSFSSILQKVLTE